MTLGRGDQKRFLRQDAVEFSVDVFLDGRQIKRPLFTGKTHRLAVRPGPPRPTDAMDIVLRFIGQGVVDNKGDPLDMDAPSGHICCQLHPAL